jgi:hypothetical protein
VITPAAHEVRATTACLGIRCGRAVDPIAFREIVRTMALDHHKWDAQVGDVAALAPFPIVVRRAAWEDLCRLAGARAAETSAVEAELVIRPELHRVLGIPRPLDRALRELARGRATPSASRIMRFDFHPTREGWRVSEVNSDVPGGFTEAFHFTSLVAPRARREPSPC